MKRRIMQVIREGAMCIIGALFALAAAFIIVAGIYQICEWCHLIRDAKADTMAADIPAVGVGRVPEAARYLGGEEAEEVGASVRIWCEDDVPLPEWWDPDSATLVWSDAPKKDLGCPDWNLDSSLVGWDGHMMEEWEMDLFAKVFYLEFWGTSPECCEAGCDSMLNLWATGLYGNTMGECLSAKNDQGRWIYAPYPNVWTTDYDPEGLADCRRLCEERFANGPEWECVYFQLYGFHDPSWTVPLYEIDGVYFSAGR